MRRRSVDTVTGLAPLVSSEAPGGTTSSSHGNDLGLLLKIVGGEGANSSETKVDLITG